MQTTELESFDNKYPRCEIWIVGCGPSLLNWEPFFFRDSVCIFINTAAYYIDGLIGGRNHFYRVIFDRSALLGHHDYLDECPYYRNIKRKIPAVHSFMPQHIWDRLDTDEKNFAHGTSWSFFHSQGLDPFKYTLVGKHLFYPTLFSAMSLALRMGAGTLKLIGVDYGPVDGVTHWDRQWRPEKTALFGIDQKECMGKDMLPVCARYGAKVQRWRSPTERYEEIA